MGTATEKWLCIKIIFVIIIIMIIVIIIVIIKSCVVTVLFFMEQGCGGAWRSGKSPVTLGTKEMVAVTKLMRLITHLYIFMYIFCLFIYLFVSFFLYLFVCLFNYLFIYSLFPLYYWNLDVSIRPKGSHLDR